MSTEIVKQGYERIAASYHERRKTASTQWYETLLSLVPDGGSVLDVGCGGGVPVAKLFADRGYSISGCDISAEMVRIATANVPSGSFEVADMRSLPYEDESFDLLISLFALIHVERQEHTRVLQECSRVLKPGAKLVVSMGVTDNPEEVKEDWYGARMFWSHYDSERNEQLVREAGFTILSSEETTTRSGERHLMVIAEKSQR